ncbi:MAG: MFS transporter, partial [Gemmatimonadota bacterium]|nr:MFS transporter [Gemmatimonadota bacterium]
KDPNMQKISVLIGIGFVDMLGFAMVFPLLPFYALRLQAPEWVIGWMIASFSITQLASAPLWGRVSDRFGRRPALLVGLAASGMAFVVFGFATTIWMLFLSRIIQGAGGGTTGVAQAYIGDAVEPKHRTRALGWLSAATSAGVMIGPAIGSLATSLGPEAPGLIAAGLCFLNVGFAWRWLPETSPSRRDPSAPAPVRRSIHTVVLDVIRHPGAPVSRLIWIYAIGMLGFMSMTSVLALYLEHAFAVTEKTIGLFFVYTGALGVVMRAVILGRVTDLFGEVRVLRLGALSLALGLALTPLPHTVVLLALVIALVPIGTALLFPATSALVTQLAPDAERGQVLGVQQTFGGVARVIAPIWATAAFQTLGVAVPFYIAGAVVGVVLIMALRVKSTAT